MPTFTVRHVDDLTDEDRTPGHWDVAVVIDVLRAFTVAPWVLRQGAHALYLAPDAATALAAQTDDFPDALLIKDGRPDPRFDLPNAPGRIAELDLTGRTVIQTTGNGTRGAHAVRHVPTVVCASFATAGATARLVAGAQRVLLVTTEGDEDVAFADHLIALVTSPAPPNPAPYLARVAAAPAGLECLARAHDPAHPGVHPDDLALAQQVDAFDHALIARPRGALLHVITHTHQEATP